MTSKIAVVGATGNVGREIINILHERNFPIRDLVALASERSVGKQISFGDQDILVVSELDKFSFDGCDIALFTAGSAVSEKYVPRATSAGCVVIDNTSFFRMDPDIPLVVPEINPEALDIFDKKNIVANPNCCIAQIAMVLKPLHDLVKVKRVVVSTYQSVSGAGKSAMDELYNQTKGLLMYEKVAPQKFTKQIAFNVIPHIDGFTEDGQTKEEWKMQEEIKKIVDPNIKLTATCVRVPVFVGHSAAVNIEFSKDISVSDVRKALNKFTGVQVMDKSAHNEYATPIDVVKTDHVFVSRIRKDPTQENTINLWIVADNLRKGAALNAVQIAEKLIEEYI